MVYHLIFSFITSRMTLLITTVEQAQNRCTKFSDISTEKYGVILVDQKGTVNGRCRKLVVSLSMVDIDLLAERQFSD